MQKIGASGKHLTTIYISHGDPDYDFGLDTLTAAFPDAKALAPQPVVDHINATVAGNLKFWGPKWAPTNRLKPSCPRCCKAIA